MNMKKLKQAIREATPILLILAARFIITSLFQWTDKWLSRIDDPYFIGRVALIAIVALACFDGWGGRQK